MILKEISRPDVVTASAATTLATLGQLMADKNVGAVVILDDQGKVEGIVTDRDLALALTTKGGTLSQTAGEVMTQPVHTIWEDEGVFNASQYFLGHQVRRLPVIDREDHLRGIVSIDDLFGLLARELFNVARALEPALGERI